MIKTDNMYFASFLLNEGLNIASVKMKDKKVVIGFTANDDDVEKKLAASYTQEIAVTNIRKYLTALVTIRDLIYSVSNNSRYTKYENKFSLGKIEVSND